jgi:hypothetical protein
MATLTRIALACSALAAALVLSPAAQAKSAFKASAAATIDGCIDDTLTVKGVFAAVSAKTRRPVKIPGARLMVRFDALPLFGLPRNGTWRDLGARKSGAAEGVFSGLGFDTWTVVMRYRFVRGSKNVLAGDERASSSRVGGTRGRALCVLPEGAKPRDTTAPAVGITPADLKWRRGPVTVTVHAFDDFSGVSEVIYRVDGGPLTSTRNGGTFEIAAEGQHLVEFGARDAAGNGAAGQQLVRVDGAPPTTPAIEAPRPITAGTTPTIRWSASTDSGSGLQGYYLAISRVSDGSLAGQGYYPPDVTSAQSPVSLQDGQSYRVTVTAYDFSEPIRTAGSAPFEFRVDTSPEVTGVSPASGTVLAGSDSGTDFTLTLDRPADPATVNTGSVIVDRNAESGSDPAYTVACSTPCTTITVNPGASLGEGRYVLSLNGVKSDEGVVFGQSSSAYAVPFFQDASGGSATANPCTGSTLVTNEAPVSLDAALPGENASVDYDWSATGSGTGGVRVIRDGTVQLAENSHAAPGSGHGTLTFGLASGSHTYAVQYFATCSIGDAITTFNGSNVIATRRP